jgi:undecaprenyl diphosphate synthase
MISEENMREDPHKLAQVITWCTEISADVVHRFPDRPGIESITVHISTANPQYIPKYLPAIRNVAKIAHLILHYKDQTEDAGFGIPIAIAVGKSGREEIIDAIRNMAKDSVVPEQVDEHKIEQYLTFQHTPDFVIKTGGSHLVDFLIWQSVYSELFFLDLNWENLRKVDILRSFRDYQARIRRFGA